MVPRQEMVTPEQRATLAVIRSVLVARPHTRLPVQARSGRSCRPRCTARRPTSASFAVAHAAGAPIRLIAAEQDPVARGDRVARLLAVPRHDEHQPAEAPEVLGQSEPRRARRARADRRCFGLRAVRRHRASRESGSAAAVETRACVASLRMLPRTGDRRRVGAPSLRRYETKPVITSANRWRYC